MAIENADQSKMKIAYLQSTLDSKEDGFRDKIEKLINSHRYEVDSEVSKATDILQKNYGKQLKNLQDTLQRSNFAYQTLESEFRNYMIQERKSTEEREQTIFEKSQAIELMSRRDKEQTITITELVELVKQLKSKLEHSNINQQEMNKIHTVIIW